MVLDRVVALMAAVVAGNVYHYTPEKVWKTDMLTTPRIASGMKYAVFVYPDNAIYQAGGGTTCATQTTLDFNVTGVYEHGQSDLPWEQGVDLNVAELKERMAADIKNAVHKVRAEDLPEVDLLLQSVNYSMYAPGKAIVECQFTAQWDDQDER